MSARDKEKLQEDGQEEVNTASVTVLRPAVKDIAQTVRKKIKSAGELQKEEIPDFDERELQQAMTQFIERLNAALPAERKTEENSEKTLNDLVVKIARDAKELKTLDVNLSLSAEQRERSAAARKAVPKYLRVSAKEEWDLHLRLLTELLRQLKNEGMEMMAKVGKNGITVNARTLKKMKSLLQAMMASHPKVNQLAVFELTTKEIERSNELKRSMKAKPPRFYGVNHEDIVDEEIDDQLYGEILEALAAKTPPRKLAKKYIFALFVNFQHLKNSHAGQILGSIGDIAQFPGESKTVEYLLAILDRSIKGITAAQKIAQLMG